MIPGSLRASAPSPLQEAISEAQPEAKSEAREEQDSSLETKIGLYWLSRIGIVFLVIGVSSLILYSFQYFGSWAKLLTGFLVAGGLIAGGEFVDRKQGMRWYGNALAGGGWALAYFTTYAMHHVPDVRVIASPMTGSALMLTVAMAAICHSLYKNSELIATLAISLGFITLGLTEIGPFSAAASAILTGAFAYLVHRCKWNGLYILGVAMSFFFEYGAIDSHGGIDPALRLAFVLPYWLAASFLPLSLPAIGENVKAATVAAAIIAAICSFGSLHPVFLQLGAHSDGVLFLTGTVVYAALALLMHKQARPSAALANSLIGLSSLALAVPAFCNGPLRMLSWTLQLALILWAGTYYKLRSFRLFAFPLSLTVLGSTLWEMFFKYHWFKELQESSLIVAGLHIPYSALSALPAFIVFATATYFYQSKLKDIISDASRTFSFYWYFHLAGLLAFWVVPILYFAPGSSIGNLGFGCLALGWSVEALGIGLLALAWQRKYLVLASFVALLLCFVSSFFSEDSLAKLVPAFASIAVPFILAAKARSTAEIMGPRTLFNCYFIFGSLWLFLFQTRIPGPDLVVSAFAAEALILILLGKKMQDVTVRTMGVLAGSMLMFGLLFDDRLTWNSILPSVVALFYSGHLYKSLSYGDKLDETRRIVRHYFNIGATLALTCAVGWRLQNYFVSCAWAVEALLLLGAGFYLKDKPLRICGLSVFGLVIGRLLIFDLASAQTIYRIIAFIVAGVLLMVAAYAYSWFTKKIQSSE